MDPITRIAKDTGVPREVLVKVVAKTVTEHRVIINDDDGIDESAEHGELVSMSEAAERLDIPHTTISSWVRRGHLTDHGQLAKAPGQPRLVDLDEVARVAAETRRPGPRGPRKRTPAYLDSEYSTAR